MSRGIFRSFVDSIKKITAIRSIPDRLVGQDEIGNKYYERPADPDRGIKLQRRVEPPFTDQFRVPEVPAEWMTWLQSRRLNPPTPEELHKNLQISLRTKQRAEDLENTRLQEEGDVQAPESSQAKQNFPKYDDYEIHPGQFSSKAPEKD